MKLFAALSMVLASVIGTSSIASAQSSPGMTGVAKKTVCTVTINSTDEKEAFMKYLHPDYFNFVELVKNKTDVGFLDRSCKKKDLKCDVVLVSGHFGGGFTDNKEFFLAIEDMERTSCKSCPSVLGGAQMVYLFGCNTLAGKNMDGRTVEEYVRVLVDEVGLDPAEARATAAVRYSAIGDSFNDRMRRVFRGSSAIGGFNTKAPLGEQVQPSINAFFGGLAQGLKHDGNLEEWERRAISEAFYMDMDRIAAGQANGQNQALYDANKRLQPTLAAAVGGGYTDVPGIRSGSTEDFVAQKLCSAGAGGKLKLPAVEEIINLGDRNAIIQMLPYLLEISRRGESMNGEQKQFFARLSSNPQLREILSGEKGIINQLNDAPEEQTKTVDLAFNVGWLDQATVDAYYHKAAVFIWNNAGGFVKNKKLMSKMKDDLAAVQPSEIQPRAFRGLAVWSLIADRHGNDPAWAAVAAANIGSSVQYFTKRVEAAQANLRISNLSRDGQKLNKAKIDQARKDMESVCSTLGKITGLGAQRASLMAPHSASIAALGASKCMR